MAQAKPGKVTFASTGIGGPPHLAGELLKTMIGIDMTHVPYKGTGPALTACLAAGHHDVFRPDRGGTHIPGKLRSLAVSSPKRFALLPNPPDGRGAGVAGYSAVGWAALLAPAGTPDLSIAKLHAEFARVLPLPKIREPRRRRR